MISRVFSRRSTFILFPTRTVAVLAVSALAATLVAGCTSEHPDNAAGGSAPVSTPPIAPPIADVSPAALAEAVTLERVMPHIRALQQIADNHGGNRASGTPGYDASLDYVAGLLRDAGFEVTTPTVDYKRFDAGPVTLTADGNKVDAEVLEYSAGTGETPVTATPVSVGGLGCAPADYPPQVRGAVAVITRGTCTFADKARNAQAAGALAAIMVNDEEGPLQGGTLGAEDTQRLPVVGIPTATADRIRAARSVTVSVNATTKPVTTRNLLAETRTGTPDDVVLAGAHLDSVSEGPGINDNATGVAAVLETALRLGSSPRVPHRVRFGFWSGEEDGLIGSSEYVAALDEPARRALALYLNFDMLGSPNGGYFVYDGDDSRSRDDSATDDSGSTDDSEGPGPAGSPGIERVFEKFYADRGVILEPTDFDGRSDYGPFIAVGIPAGGVFSGAEDKKTQAQADVWGGTAGQAFDPEYHTPRDTVDNIDTEILAVNSAAVAYALATYALSTGGPDGVPPLDQRQRAPA